MKKTEILLHFTFFNWISNQRRWREVERTEYSTKNRKRLYLQNLIQNWKKEYTGGPRREKVKTSKHTHTHKSQRRGTSRQAGRQADRYRKYSWKHINMMIEFRTYHRFVRHYPLSLCFSLKRKAPHIKCIQTPRKHTQKHEFRFFIISF